LGIKKPWANQEPYNPSIDVEEPLAKHKQPWLIICCYVCASRSTSNQPPHPKYPRTNRTSNECVRSTTHLPRPPAGIARLTARGALAVQETRQLTAATARNLGLGKRREEGGGVPERRWPWPSPRAAAPPPRAPPHRHLLEPPRVVSGTEALRVVVLPCWGGISIRRSRGPDCFWAKLRRGKTKLGRLPFRARPNRTANPMRPKIENRPFQSAGLGLIPGQSGRTEWGLNVRKEKGNDKVCLWKTKQCPCLHYTPKLIISAKFTPYHNIVHIFTT
jgi:hypothetical protein